VVTDEGNTDEMPTIEVASTEFEAYVGQQNTQVAVESAGGSSGVTIKKFNKNVRCGATDADSVTIEVRSALETFAEPTMQPSRAPSRAPSLSPSISGAAVRSESMRQLFQRSQEEYRASRSIENGISEVGQTERATSRALQAENSSTVTVVLQSIRALNYNVLNPSRRLINCSKYQDTETTFDDVCPGNINVTYSCPALATGYILLDCPERREEPRCTTFNDIADAFVVNDACSVVDFTATSTTCKCAFPPGVSVSWEFSTVMVEVTLGK
jgi:hypothetical protein